MAKKSKNKAEKQASSQEQEPPKAAPKQKKTAPKKKAVPAVKPAGAKQAPSTISTWEPSDEQIRTRAYFIAERRIQLSLSGDSDHDWIEARRQLIEEAGRASS